MQPPHRHLLLRWQQEKESPFRSTSTCWVLSAWPLDSPLLALTSHLHALPALLSSISAAHIFHTCQSMPALTSYILFTHNAASIYWTNSLLSLSASMSLLCILPNSMPLFTSSLLATVDLTSCRSFINICFVVLLEQVCLYEHVNE